MYFSKPYVIKIFFLKKKTQDDAMLSIELERSCFVSSCRAGCIYWARVNDMKVAVKYCTKKDLFDKVKNEITIMQYLNNKGCTFVPRLIDSYLEDGVYFVIMDFIKGEHLKFYDMSRERKTQYLNALRNIHNFGILHGDIREENFLATESGVVLIDFEFSRKAEISELQAEFNQLRLELC